MTELPLSPDMAEALAFAYAHGRRLVRYVGGYWSASDVTRSRGIPDVYYGTTTVEALVRRGKLEYSQWRDGRQGRFPVEAIVKEPP